MAQTIILFPTAAAVDYTTAPVLLDGILGYSIQLYLTGSDVAASFKLQVSNDGVHFLDLANSTQAITNSTGYIFNFSDVQYKWVRGAFDYTSGTGNLTLTFYTKFGD